MNNETKKTLEAVRDGSLTVEEALLKLKTEPFEDLGFAKVDLHRRIRQGMPEVIYGAGKTAAQIAGIIRTMQKNGQTHILVTRVSPDAYGKIEQELAKIPKQEQVSTDAASGREQEPDADGERKTAQPELTYFETARIALAGEIKTADGIGTIVVATGGTSDLPVAEEAAVTAQAYGNEVVRLYDVGVAGLHRLLSHKEEIMQASVIIAIAGMEGALASVIGGLADCPVIAVPTSVGYGAAFDGLSALLSMMNSCASGVSVVNIDNGFGAGYLASMINHMEAKPKPE